jgi:hypothetical protein
MRDGLKGSSAKTGGGTCLTCVVGCDKFIKNMKMMGIDVWMTTQEFNEAIRKHYFCSMPLEDGITSATANRGTLPNDTQSPAAQMVYQMMQEMMEHQEQLMDDS